MTDEQEHRSTLVQRLRGTKHTIQEAFRDMREAADRIVALEAERDRLSERLNYAAHDVERRDERIVALVAERDRLAAALRQIREIHQPEWVNEKAKAEGKEPWVCIYCSVADGSWPCDTRMMVDEALGAAGSTDSSTP